MKPVIPSVFWRMCFHPRTPWHHGMKPWKTETAAKDIKTRPVLVQKKQGKRLKEKKICSTSVARKEQNTSNYKYLQVSEYPLYLDNFPKKNIHHPLQQLTQHSPRYKSPSTTEAISAFGPFLAQLQRDHQLQLLQLRPLHQKHAIFSRNKHLKELTRRQVVRS